MSGVIDARSVRRTYGETVALDGVSLSVEAGEVFALIGPNGAGKTTLVRALTGTTTPDAGAIELFGAPPEHVRRQRIGLLPQSFSPPERLTARELVAYYAGLYDNARDTDDVLESVGVADAADTRYGNLSGGQQRRVCVGTTLVNDPELLFLDEPTTGIDPAGRRDMWDLIESLADAGSTVFLTTHYMAEAERLADRVGLLADGQLAAVGGPRELVAEHGGEARLEIETTARPEAFEDSPFMPSATEDGLVVPGIDPVEIGDVVAVLEAQDIDYDAITWREPDLEDVYLELAGESLDVEGEDPVEPVATTAGGDR